MNRIMIAVMISYSMVITGCSSIAQLSPFEQVPDTSQATEQSPAAYTQKQQPVQTQPLPTADIDWPMAVQPLPGNSLSNRQELKQVLKSLGETGIDQQHFEPLLKEVESKIQRFQGGRKKWFQNALYRGEKYLPMINKVFSEKKIPAEMAWLALIESGFVHNIKSHAGARGIWQFMPQTAREYELKVNRRTDQRTDPYRATLAAREYLLDRVAVYGADSYLLVAASYNAGEGGVSRALRKLNDPVAQRNFIGVRKHLPRETRHYIPQLLAAAIIGRNPKAYGFKTDPPDRYAYVQLRQRRNVQDIARRSRISVAELRRLNPELKASMRKTPVSNFILRIPKAQAYAVMEKQIPVDKATKSATSTNRVALVQPRSAQKVSSKSRRKQSKQPFALTSGSTIPKGKYIKYRVQRGNQLGQLSVWFNTPVNRIKAWNRHIPASGHIKTGQLIKIYGLQKNWRKTHHAVKAGESLSVLAQHYDVTQQQLKAWNGLQGSRLYIGQNILVYYQAGNQTKTHTLVYRVKPGNHLTGIAALFNVPVDKIKRWNKLRSNRLTSGQQLRIQVPVNITQHRYQVKSGDSITRIAQTVGIPKKSLLFANGLQQNDTIKIGQNLVYYFV